MTVTTMKEQKIGNVSSEKMHLKLISIAIVGFCTFVGDSARGILFPALWPQCQHLGGTVADLGFLVSTFSIGRMVVSTRMGILTDQYRHRLTLILSTSILIIGAIFWANSPLEGGLLALYAAQFIMGVGTGNLGVLRSYVAEQSPPESRTFMLARLSSLQYAGFAATPLAGSALFVAGATIGQFWQYALPAYLIAGLALLCTCMLLYPFQDLDPELDDKETKKGKVVDESKEKNLFEAVTIENPILLTENTDTITKNTTTINGDKADETFVETRSAVVSIDGQVRVTEVKLLPPTDVVKKTTFLTFNIDDNVDRKSRFSSVSNFRESSFAQLRDTLTVDKAVRNISRAISQIEPSFELSPINDAPKDFVDEKIESCLKDTSFDDDKAMVFTLFILLNYTTRGVIAIFESQSSQLFLDKYGFSDLELGAFVTVCGTIGTIQLIFFKEFWCAYFSDMTLMLSGIGMMGVAQCLMVNFGPDTDHQPWRFSVAFFLIYAIAYPLGNSAVLGMFSALQKSGKQGKAQGQFALFGSIARVVNPVLAGLVNQYFDPTSAFGLALSLMGISLMGIYYFYWKIMYFALAFGKDGKAIADSPYADRNRPLDLNQWVLIVVFGLISIVGILSIFDFGDAEW